MSYSSGHQTTARGPDPAREGFLFGPFHDCTTNVERSVFLKKPLRSKQFNHEEHNL